MRSFAVPIALLAIAAACATSSYTVGERGGSDASGQGDAVASTDGSKSGSEPSFFLGADVSFVQQEEDEGRLFYDVDGTQKDILQILKNHGFNYARLRTFVDPLAAGGYDTVITPPSTTAYCDADHTVAMGARVKTAGMGLLLNFHMSDTWADPGHQAIPLAWQGYSFGQLTVEVEKYTNSVVSQLIAGNARPDIVQIGNEITAGMLFPQGSNASSWSNFATLLKAGIAGVKAADPSIKIMMHIDRGGDNATTTWWVNHAVAQGIAFDILGESCYTNYQGDPSTWQTNFSELVTQYPNLSFIIAEYAEDAADLAGNSECPSSSGPCNVWRRVNDIAFGMPNKKGLGTFVWEPTHFEETLFDDQTQAQTNDLANPFGAGVRIQMYDQMATAYGL
jgi:arabinogalactan endo-1,4-beta-galactosidase